MTKRTASQELLEVCKAMIASWDHPTSASIALRAEAIDRMRVAVKKAEEESK